MNVTPKPKWTEASMFKLYVSPVSTFDKASLTELFGQHAEIVDVYISEPNDVGFKWAFIYFATEQGLEETVAKIVQNNEHNFKLSRAKPKIFQPMGSAPATGESYGAQMTNGIAKPNGVPYVAPPNCVNRLCRKLTFTICASCRNPFCSKECMLDGWRSHTGLCVHVAELVSSDSVNGIGNTVAPMVVNFMKGCQYTKKKFTTDEFADACNTRSKINIGLQNVRTEEEKYDGARVPNPQPPAHDKGKRMAASLTNPPSPGLDNENTQWNPTKEQQTKPFVKYNRSPAPAYKPNRKSVTDTEDLEENPKHNRNPAPAYKPNRKSVTDTEDTEENPRGRVHHQKKPFDSDTDGEESVVSQSVNRYCTKEKQVDFRKSFANKPKQPAVSKVAPAARAPAQTDLNLKPRDSLSVVVTSIASTNTLFVANADHVTKVLREILDCAEHAPPLKNVEINALCLASFDGDWYRAKILSTSPIEVEYIDYGNREWCQIENLKSLPDSLNTYLPLATKVQLNAGLVQELNIKENEEIEIYVHDYDAPEGVWIVDVL